MMQLHIEKGKRTKSRAKRREREGRWASVAKKIESERGPRQKRGGGLRVNRRCTVGEGGREDGAGGGEVAADGSSDGS